MFRHVLLACTLCTVSIHGSVAFCQDRIFLLDQQDREVRRTGEVIDFTREALRYRSTQGKETKIPAARIIRVEPSLIESHASADEQFQAGNFKDAQVAYRTAFRAEKRNWLRREILSQIVKSYINLSDWRAAAQAFLLLYQDDPSTRHFDAIPLVWRPFQPDAATATEARQWLKSELPPARLIGASWLLSTADRPTAIQTLEVLTRNDDRRVAQLAHAQLWRTKMVMTRRDVVLNEWTRAVDLMEDPLRAGPYFIVGRALEKHGDTDRSVVALMRVPMQYGWMRGLAAEAMWEAARQLENARQVREAAGLYRELVRDYPGTTPATQAQERLLALSKQG